MLLSRNLSGGVYVIFWDVLAPFKCGCVCPHQQNPWEAMLPLECRLSQKLNSWLVGTSKSLPWMHWPNCGGKYPSSCSHMWKGTNESEHWNIKFHPGNIPGVTWRVDPMLLISCYWVCAFEVLPTYFLGSFWVVSPVSFSYLLFQCLVASVQCWC